MSRQSSLARLLQAVLAVQFLGAASWLGLRWETSPVQALAGAAALACIGPMVLGIECILLMLVPGNDASIPRPRFHELARAWAAEVLQMAQVFYWRLPFYWRSPADHLDPGCAGRRGVVLLHGFVCNRGLWAPWMERLRASGHPCIAVNLEPVFGSIDDYAAIVEAAVQRMSACSGLPPVLVCHSMGGLVARAWLRTVPRPAERVARVITIGSPHQGTWLARFSRTQNGQQMRQGSAWLRQLELDELSRPQPPFTCWFSNCDNVVLPATTAKRAGADNRLVPGTAHVALAFHPQVMDGSLALVADAR